MSTEQEATEALVRIRVPLERSPEEPGPADDWLWAEALGNARFRVESCPFFAYGISRDDIVHAAERAGEEAPLLDDIVEKGGHRTLRFALSPDLELAAPEVQGLLERLLELGCTHEVLRPKIVAVDLPPEVDIGVVAELLQRSTREGSLLWEWADPRPS
jgi:uncharacterized protein DUF4265